MAVELKNGWIQELGRTEFEAVPSEGQLIKFSSVESEEGSWYEVVEVNFATGATNMGDIVLRLAVDSGNATVLSVPATR